MNLPIYLTDDQSILGGGGWNEAKSSWYMIMNNPEAMKKFKNITGEQASIAKAHCATFRIFSNVTIPQQIQDWLASKRVEFVVTQ